MDRFATPEVAKCGVEIEQEKILGGSPEIRLKKGIGIFSQIFPEGYADEGEEKNSIEGLEFSGPAGLGGFVEGPFHEGRPLGR